MKFILKNPSRILEREAYLNETESRWGNSLDATRSEEHTSELQS